MVSREQELNIIEETKLLVDLFLETNLSDIELSKKTGISSSTVGRRLSNKDNYLKAFPTNGEELYERVMTNRQNNLKMAKTIGGQSSILNNIQLTDENGQYIAKIPKLRLDILSKNPNIQIKLLHHIALTFRAKLPLLSELFGMEEKEIYDGLCNGVYFQSFNYLFNVDSTDQEEARINIITYYQELLNAMRTKDKVMRKILIARIDDSIVNKIINRTEKILSDEDIEEIIKYQIKYSLTYRATAEIFHINAPNYSDRLKKYLETNPELRKKYEVLAAYNQDRFIHQYASRH